MPDDPNNSSKFHYRSAPGSDVQRLHAAGHCTELPSSFDGGFEMVQVSGVAEEGNMASSSIPSKKKRKVHVDEKAVNIIFLLAGQGEGEAPSNSSSEHPLAGLKVTMEGCGTNTFGNFQLRGELTISNDGNSASVTATKRYVLRSSRALAARTKKPISAAKDKLPEPKPRSDKSHPRKRVQKRKRSSKPVEPDSGPSKPSVKHDARASALLRLGLAVAPNMKREAERIKAREKLYLKQMGDMGRVIERFWRDDRYQFFSYLPDETKDPIFFGIHDCHKGPYMHTNTA